MRGQQLGLRQLSRQAAVLGRPIEHSLSPVLHRAAYAALGLDWTYTAIDCGIDELDEVLAVRGGWAGFSCTMPLKHALLDVASVVRPRARAVGAANTLLPGDDGWVADNTDVGGMVAALREHGVVAPTATLLGAGGTAQAAVVALDSMGVETCAVVVRDLSRAESLLVTARDLRLRVHPVTFDQAAGALDAQLVISTLPPHAADGIRTNAATVLDVVYADWPTPFAAAAADSGATVISGALMLLHQAVEQVELMTGASAPVDAMRTALIAAAPGCGLLPLPW